MSKKNKPKKTNSPISINPDKKDLKKNFIKVTENPRDNPKLPLVLSEIKKDYDEKEYSHNNVKINFKFYNEKCCELRRYDKENSKKLIQIFKDLSDIDVAGVKNNMLKKPAIKNRENSRYRDIAKNLPSDFDLFEFEIKKESRLFFSIVKDYFLVIAITFNHR